MGLIVVGLLLAAPSSACSDGGPEQVRKPPPPPTSAASTTTEPGGSPTPRATAGEALEALLRAEQDADHATSFRLLDPSGREQYRDVAEWTRRRVQLPAITGFSIERDAGRQVVALVEHEPGLDPFTGLSAAKERQTWTATSSGTGFLLGPEPEVEYVLPPDEAAGPAVLEWARSVQACDQQAAAAKEAVQPLFGSSTGATKLCGSPTALTTGEVEPLDGGPRSAELVAQYSTDALAWARVVTLRGPEPEVKVVVAPIGTSWRVLAIYD